jgi:hypothetical protein
MTTTIPAAPGTTLIDGDGMPIAAVVGWQYIQNNMVFPLFATARSGVTSKEAIRHPDGTVTHPASGKLFDDADGFAGHLMLTTEETDAAEPVKGAGPDLSPIVFGDKTFSQNAFYYWPNANAVFQIKGGAVQPNDPRVKKVKRDEWYAFKREGAFSIDPHLGVIHEEEPKTETASPAEDDDDMSVV